MPLDKSSKKKLLDIARQTIVSVLSHQKMPSLNVKEPELLEKRGVFVTLKKGEDLRGCIGCLKSEWPLYWAVQEMASSSAFRDPRFKPVTRAELDDLTIEISVLSPLKSIRHASEIILGEHGILIQKGDRSGCFLPQVAQETGWSLEEFLGHCARDKAGLGWDDWREADIFVFAAEVFSESH